MKASSWRRMRQAFFIASSFLSWSAAAQVPAFVPYSGRLTDGTGWGQSTQLDIRVRLYDAQTGGNIIFEGLHPATPVVDGYFTVNIGMCDAQGYCDPNPTNAKFPTTLPPQLWLSIAVGEGAEMEPRQPVGSVPYAVVSRQLSESGLSSLDQRFVNEGQTSAITSGMIATGQISDAHIAPDAAIEFSKLSGVAAASHSHDAVYLKNTGGTLSGSLTVQGNVSITNALSAGSISVSGDLVVAGGAIIGGRPFLTTGNLDFYVDALIGNDVTGQGTAEKPWRTIQAAIDHVPWHVNHWVTIHVAPGTYSGCSIKGLSGAGRLYIIGSANEASPSIIEVSGVYGYGVRIAGCSLSYIALQNLTIRRASGTDNNGILVEGSTHIEIGYCRIDGFTGQQGNLNRGVQFIGSLGTIFSCQFSNSYVAVESSRSVLSCHDCTGAGTINYGYFASYGGVLYAEKPMGTSPYNCWGGIIFNWPGRNLCP